MLEHENSSHNINNNNNKSTNSKYCPPLRLWNFVSGQTEHMYILVVHLCNVCTLSNAFDANISTTEESYITMNARNAHDKKRNKQKIAKEGQ